MIAAGLPVIRFVRQTAAGSVGVGPTDAARRRGARQRPGPRRRPGRGRSGPPSTPATRVTRPGTDARRGRGIRSATGPRGGRSGPVAGRRVAATAAPARGQSGDWRLRRQLRRAAPSGGPGGGELQRRRLRRRSGGPRLAAVRMVSVTARRDLGSGCRCGGGARAALAGSDGCDSPCDCNALLLRTVTALLLARRSTPACGKRAAWLPAASRGYQRVVEPSTAAWRRWPASRAARAVDLRARGRRGVGGPAPWARDAEAAAGSRAARTMNERTWSGEQGEPRRGSGRPAVEAPARAELLRRGPAARPPELWCRCSTAAALRSEPVRQNAANAATSVAASASRAATSGWARSRSGGTSASRTSEPSSA